MPTDSVERGRLPGASEAGSPSSSQNICARVPSGKPSAGMTGEDCSQPPDGVAVNMLPALSMMSTWVVSPRTWPSGETSSAPCPVWARANVGSPAPAPTARASLMMTRPVKPAIVPGRCSIDATLPTSLRRSAL